MLFDWNVSILHIFIILNLGYILILGLHVSFADVVPDNGRSLEIHIVWKERERVKKEKKLRIES